MLYLGFYRREELRSLVKSNKVFTLNFCSYFETIFYIIISAVTVYLPMFVCLSDNLRFTFICTAFVMSRKIQFEKIEVLDTNFKLQEIKFQINYDFDVSDLSQV